MKEMPKTIKYSLFLVVLGIIAGVLLAFVNSITAPIIDARKEEELKEVLEEYFECDKFSDETANYSLDKGIEKIYFGYIGNNLTMVIYQASTNGYAGPVVSLVGINIADDKLVDIKVASADKETSGIGSKVIGHDFNITGESINDYSFDIISGATVSSNAVKNNLVIAINHYTDNKALFEKAS
ncbi:MAG: FMN-binding protein [Bacilli bacterium]|jgi:electron transport complex protein RnfG|nr:FMN-binding protein [Bacilli bacterium]MDD4056652.1 FMN-binding protein [Bacilli bacterium]MDY0209355.1 FMN-binding protein [Bacilli bacterium]